MSHSLLPVLPVLIVATVLVGTVISLYNWATDNAPEADTEEP